MKVVEKLFLSYLGIAPDDYVKKYLAATSVLDITDETGVQRKKVFDMRDKISDEFPFSLFKATSFLAAKETRLMIRLGDETISLNKKEGDDYKLRDALGRFIERVNTIVIESMNKYNTDRGRKGNAEESLTFEEE